MSEAASAEEILALADWRRRVATLYAQIRAAGAGEDAWHAWCRARDRLYRSHPQSPIPNEQRSRFEGLAYYPYDPAFRVLAEVEHVEPEHGILGGSAGQTFGATRFGAAAFELLGREVRLTLLWLDGYAGGLFCCFRDGTGGDETYAAGRYVLDTVKGADLGTEDGRLVLDFNFAYQPSCAYDPTWACPLAPPENRVPVAIRAGERLA